MFGGIYQGKNVLVTGHSGFKGSWLAYWLQELGANVYGLALNPSTNPSHLELLENNNLLKIKNYFGDIRKTSFVQNVINETQPEVIFHLAAQPLVRDSYEKPIETFETNIMGSLNLYECARASSSLRAIVSITTDKVYENKEWEWGYREIDRLGGHDPYSASKAAMEIVTSSFQKSFFSLAQYKKSHHVLLSTVRAGNVIGGGDWSKDRLICDIVKAASKKMSVDIRSPHSTRPWQHVLEPLSGYLQVGQKLLEEKEEFATAWNIGPNENEEHNVWEVGKHMNRYWPDVRLIDKSGGDHPHEAGLLKLDCSKARKKLGWKPVWSIGPTVEKTARWYKDYYEKNILRTQQDLKEFIEDAQKLEIPWVL